MIPRCILRVVVCVGFVSLPALADDYPQWRGPHRDGLSAETGLLKEWPKGGPKLAWKTTTLGEGYSTPSVAKGRIYLESTRQDAEWAIALEEKDGKEVWATRLGAVGKNNGPQYPGPRATPTVDGDLVFALGSDGDLVCLETAKGTVRWRKNLRTDFGGEQGRWAYAESPLVDGDVVVCTPGGKKATLVALHKQTGDVVWKAAIPGGDAAAYASPVIGEVGGIRQYIQFLQKGVVGVEARTGKFLWRYAESANKTANIPSPLFHDGYVFSASGYGKGGGAAKLTARDGGVAATPVYFVDELVNQIGGCVRVGDHLYGTNASVLLCLEFTTGKVKWRQKGLGKSSLCYADGNLYVRVEKGPMVLVEASPLAYRERGRFEQPDRSKKPAWPYPVVANGHLYLRDQGVLLCYDVRRMTVSQVGRP